MVLKSCGRPPKQPMVLLYMVQEGLANGFKTMRNSFAYAQRKGKAQIKAQGKIV